MPKYTEKDFDTNFTDGVKAIVERRVDELKILTVAPLSDGQMVRVVELAVREYNAKMQLLFDKYKKDDAFKNYLENQVYDLLKRSCNV